MRASGVASEPQLLAAWAATSFGGALGALAPVLFAAAPASTLSAVAGGIAALALLARGSAATGADLSLLMFVYGAGSGALLGLLTKSVSGAATPRDEGVAQGLFFSAYAAGAAVAAAVSAPLSAALGGWRGVFAFWGLLAGASIGLWSMIVRVARPHDDRADSRSDARVKSGSTLGAVVGGLWPLFLAYGAYTGAYLGFSGLAPLWLEAKGWSPAEAGAPHGHTTVRRTSARIR